MKRNQCEHPPPSALNKELPADARLVFPRCSMECVGLQIHLCTVHIYGHESGFYFLPRFVFELRSPSEHLKDVNWMIHFSPNMSLHKEGLTTYV